MTKEFDDALKKQPDLKVKFFITTSGNTTAAMMPQVHRMQEDTPDPIERWGSRTLRELAVEWAIHGFRVLLTTWWRCVRLSFCFRMNVENGDAHIRAKQTQQMDIMAPTCAQTIKNCTLVVGIFMGDSSEGHKAFWREHHEDLLKKKVLRYRILGGLTPDLAPLDREANKMFKNQSKDHQQRLEVAKCEENPNPEQCAWTSCRVL